MEKSIQVIEALKDYDTSQAISYHHGNFPPSFIDYRRLFPVASRARQALGQYDQMLSSMLNNDILLAPMRSQEAVAS